MTLNDAVFFCILFGVGRAYGAWLGWTIARAKR